MFIQILATGFLIIFLNLGQRQQGDMRYIVKWPTLYLVVVVIILIVYLDLKKNKECSFRSAFPPPPTLPKKRQKENKQRQTKTPKEEKSLTFGSDHFYNHQIGVLELPSRLIVPAFMWIILIF